jgi:hypothetical protein
MIRKSHAPRHPKKRPYRTPVLTVHGDFRTLAMAKPGPNNDGTGKPRTKAGGNAA